MPNVTQSLETNDRPFLESVLIDGKDIPSPVELIEIIKRIDLEEEFRNTQFADIEDRPEDSQALSLSFDSLEHSHLFCLVLMARGVERKLFFNGPSTDYFIEKQLDDFRIDGRQFSYSESLKSSPRVAVRLYLKLPEDYKKDHDLYTELVTGAINDCMPHLSADIKNFKM